MDISDIPHTFRRSKRAKHISMRILADRGLEVILPVGVDEQQGLRFFKKNSAWVEKHRDMLEPKQIEHEKSRHALVKQIKLACIDKTVTVRYLQMQTRTIQLRTPLPEVLIFMGKIKDARCCQAKLDHWLKQQARLHLLPMLFTLQAQTGLRYHKASIRLQRSRWGSCSARGTISLNARLLYYPYDVVRYVMIHELCHLKELNHSRRFWRLVESFEPRYRELKAQLIY